VKAGEGMKLLLLLVVVVEASSPGRVHWVIPKAALQ
jgi:hypothetical protein